MGGLSRKDELVLCLRHQSQLPKPKRILRALGRMTKAKKLKWVSCISGHSTEIIRERPVGCKTIFQIVVCTDHLHPLICIMPKGIHMKIAFQYPANDKDFQYLLKQIRA